MKPREHTYQGNSLPLNPEADWDRVETTREMLQDETRLRLGRNFLQNQKVKNELKIENRKEFEDRESAGEEAVVENAEGDLNVELGSIDGRATHEALKKRPVEFSFRAKLQVTKHPTITRLPFDNEMEFQVNTVNTVAPTRQGMPAIGESMLFWRADRSVDELQKLFENKNKAQLETFGITVTGIPAGVDFKITTKQAHALAEECSLAFVGTAFDLGDSTILNREFAKSFVHKDPSLAQVLLPPPTTPLSELNKQRVASQYIAELEAVRQLQPNDMPEENWEDINKEIPKIEADLKVINAGAPPPTGPFTSDFFKKGFNGSPIGTYAVFSVLDPSDKVAFIASVNKRQTMLVKTKEYFSKLKPRLEDAYRVVEKMHGKIPSSLESLFNLAGAHPVLIIKKIDAKVDAFNIAKEVKEAYGLKSRPQDYDKDISEALAGGHAHPEGPKGMEAIVMVIAKHYEKKGMDPNSALQRALGMYMVNEMISKETRLLDRGVEKAAGAELVLTNGITNGVKSFFGGMLRGSDEAFMCRLAEHVGDLAPGTGKADIPNNQIKWEAPKGFGDFFLKLPQYASNIVSGWRPALYSAAKWSVGRAVIGTLYPPALLPMAAAGIVSTAYRMCVPHFAHAREVLEEQNKAENKPASSGWAKVCKWLSLDPIDRFVGTRMLGFAWPRFRARPPWGNKKLNTRDNIQVLWNAMIKATDAEHPDHKNRVIGNTWYVKAQMRTIARKLPKLFVEAAEAAAMNEKGMTPEIWKKMSLTNQRKKIDTYIDEIMTKGFTKDPAIVERSQEAFEYASKSGWFSARRLFPAIGNVVNQPGLNRKKVEAPKADDKHDHGGHKEEHH